jgi:hypothetical protein
MLVAKRNQGGEYEHHIVSVKMRVTGSGNLQLDLADLDDIQVQNLVDVPMTPTTRFEPLRLANLQSQRIRLVGHVDTIDEWFQIQRIIIFAKPVAMEYPA